MLPTHLMLSLFYSVIIIKKLAERLSLLDQSLSNEYQSDIMIFHTSYPYSSDISSIINSTKRRVIFHNVDREFSSFPLKFDPYSTDPTWSKRGKWNYHHMCYFWFKQVFNLNILKPYRYMMRLDDDSQIIRTLLLFVLNVKKNSCFLFVKRSLDKSIRFNGTKSFNLLCK